MWSDRFWKEGWEEKAPTSLTLCLQLYQSSPGRAWALLLQGHTAVPEPRPVLAAAVHQFLLQISSDWARFNSTHRKCQSLSQDFLGLTQDFEGTRLLDRMFAVKPLQQTQNYKMFYLSWIHMKWIGTGGGGSLSMYMETICTLKNKTTNPSQKCNCK